MSRRRRGSGAGPMTLIDDVQATNDVALAVTSALEQVLGEDVILAVGVAQREAPGADVLPEGATRAVSLMLSEGIAGEIALIVGSQLSAALEARASDELLTSSTNAALEAGAGAIGGLVDANVQFGRVGEVSPDAGVSPQRAPSLVIKLAIPESAPSIALHEFEPLNDGAASFAGSRPLAILKDVEMGVTAELGRRRMTVRDLLALPPRWVLG